MALPAGSRLGHYEILAPLGAGGMGEVYKARDPRLNRSVAIKVVPSHIAEREDLRQRFEREAQTLAALNHPHICVVHDVGRHEGTDYLVMELLDGETLADRLARGPLPFDQLLVLATQIADALDKAHRHGITHRDLKPGNVMLTKGGVKLLDFGLARVREPGQGVAASVVATYAPTAKPLTAEGTILGTLQYMAPEQLEGREVDVRADIFSLGAVLYEMATGRRAFDGKSQVSVIAAVLGSEPPPVSSLVPLSPPLFDDVVRTCLAKDPDARWQSAADVLRVLALVPKHAAAAPAATSPGGGRRVLPWAVAAAVVGLAAGLGTAGLGVLPQSDPPPAPRVAFEIDAPISVTGGNTPYFFAVSPDGRSLVARVRPPGAEAADGARDLLWVRPLDRVEGTYLEGTQDAQWPCWSPDGRSLAFFVGSELRMMDAGGGPQQVLAGSNVVSIARGCTWNAQGTIVFVGDPALGLFGVQVSGGSPMPLALVGKRGGALSYRWPVFLPDGTHFLFHLEANSPDQSGIYVGSIDSGEIRRVGPSSIKPQFAPPDLLLFGRDNVLMAQRFDTSRLELIGTPVRVAGDLDTAPEQAGAGVSVSANGVLAYRPGRPGGNRLLAWTDRLGQRVGQVGSAAPYLNPRLSPDGSRLAVAREDGSADIWVLDLARGTSTRLTFDAASEDTPVWSPDGQRIAFVSNRRGGVFDIYVKNANGTGDEQLLFASPDDKMVGDWSADGRYLVFESQNAATRSDLWALPLTGERQPMKLVGSPFTERAGVVSPDGRWLAYTSDEAGSIQLFVQTFPNPGGKWQVSNTLRGALPQWRADGKELFYDASGRLVSVDVSATRPGAELTWSSPQPLFAGLLSLWPHNFDVSRDGTRFLVLARERPADRVEPIVVMMNWQAGLTGAPSSE